MDRDISRTIVNNVIIFSTTQIYKKTVTFKKFHCCGDAPANCFLQYFCHYFYNCCSYFSSRIILFTLMISFIVTIYLSLIFVDCMFIFFKYTLNEQLILRRKNHARKRSCNFLEMQLFIVYSNSFLLWGVAQQCYLWLTWIFQCTTIFMSKVSVLKKQKVDSCYI